MKKFLQWVMAATLVCGASVFTACSSDDDDNNNSGNNETKGGKNRQEFVEHTRANAIKVLLVPVLAHGVYDSLAMSGTVDPVAGALSFMVLIYFCIKLQKQAQRRVNSLVGR